MGEVQTSFDKILTLTAEEADPLVIEEEDDGVSQDILERSLVAKLYSPKPVHKKSFKNRMLEIWDPVGESSHDQIASNMLIGEKRIGEPVMEGEASKHRKVDNGKNTEIVMYESVMGPKMLVHHEQ
ncbi:unnamed protein product [Prunus brigantina]